MQGTQKKLYIRLFIAVVALVTAVVMIGTVSYAWLTLSTAPEVSGAQVMIGGGNTILLAPDIAQTDPLTGATVHYPGAFGDTLNFSQTTYEYLRDLSGLEPVSTADGQHWILQTGVDANGDPIFTADTTLTHANKTADDRTNGHYIYLDFWMVSPGSSYVVRVSTDTKSGDGSSLVELPTVEKSGGSYSLADGSGLVASIARVGFLVNEGVRNEDVSAYVESEAYDTRYSTLRGVFPEKGEDLPATPAEGTRFTIYEPNGTLHPGGADGSYRITSPRGYALEDGSDRATYPETDISGILTVQKQSGWRTDENDELLLSSALATAVAGQDDSLTAAEAEERLFSRQLQWLLSPYIRSGGFVSSTAGLYAAASEGTVSAEDLDGLAAGGATADVYITQLERNVPQRVRMFLWLEGQDADCASAAEASSFALSLELAGADP